MGTGLELFIFVASTTYQIVQQQKLKRAQERAAEARKGFQFTIAGESTALPIAYGKNLLGGIEVKHHITSNYTQATDNSDNTFSTDFTNTSVSGSKNEFLHVQHALCHGGIEGVQWIKINDTNYNNTEPKFKHLLRTFKDGGSADAIATANGIPSTNTFTGVAYASSTFKLNRDDQNYSGVPTAGFLVKGRKVRWIEESSGSYSLSSQFIYSNNPALCLLDYITNADFGRGLPASGIDLESFYHAAEVCDTIVATNRSTGGQVNGQKTIHTVADLGSRPTNLEKRTYENELWYTTASSEYWYWDKTAWVLTTQTQSRPLPLYECNITLDSSSTIRDNIEKIMNTMGLAELTWSSEGKYKLLLEYPTTVAEQNALVDATHYFDDDSIVRNKINVSYPAASDRLNQCTVTFANEHEDFKEDSITFPETNSTAHNTFLTEDNNQPFIGDLSIDGITDPYHALASAEQAVRKSRSLFTLDLTVTKKGLNLEPGDFINVTSSVTDITSEVFRVESIKVNQDFTVNLTCYKFDYTILAWNVANNIAYTNQPVFDFSVDAPTLGSFTVNTSNILGTASGKLAWTFANDISAVEYLVEISADSGTTYEVLGTTRANTFDVTGLAAGVYDFSIRSRSPSGKLSTRLLIQNETVQLTAAGSVAIVYADTIDAATNTQSYTLGSNNFVAYYPYSGSQPTLPVRSNITFAKFVGESGATGVSIKLQYSSNNSSWHDTLLSTDNYIRTGTLTPPATTYVYGIGVKFVPELGVEYDNGDDGLNAYLHIAYATTSSGGGFSQSPTGKDYIGSYTDNTAADSIYASDYTWALIKGADGYTPIKNVDYFDGDDGTSIKLQYSGNNTSWHDTLLSTDNYIRTGTKTPPATTYTYGTGVKFVPELGVEYDNGDDGLNAYLHIAYADDASGNGFSQSPTGKDYIGSYTDNTQADSNTASDYTWALIKGSDALSIIMSNESHNLAAEATGTSNIIYTGSGTSIELFRGATALTATTGTVNSANEFKVVGAVTGITLGSTSTASNIFTFADHSGWTSSSDAITITYTITVRNEANTANEVYTKVQSLTLSRAGASGVGERGAGWWRYETGTSASTASLSDTAINTFFAAATGLTVVAGDRLIVTNTATPSEATGYLRNNANTAWAEQAEFIDGDLLVSGTVTAEQIAADTITTSNLQAGVIKSGNIDAGAVSADKMTIDGELILGNDAGFLAGRTFNSAYEDAGFFVGRETRADNSQGFELSTSSTNSSNELTGIIHNEQEHLKLFNPLFSVGGNVSGGVTTYTTTQTINLGVNTGRSITVTAIGGGGGGGGGHDNQGDNVGGLGGTGGTTSVSIYHSNTTSGNLITSLSATGATGGQSGGGGRASVGGSGASSSFGVGGGGGSLNSPGNDASALSYGAGGGGAGGDASSTFDHSGAAGLGGNAAQAVVENITNITYTTDIYAVVTSVGASGAGDTSAVTYAGGNGGSGAVAISSVFGGTTEYTTSEFGNLGFDSYLKYFGTRHSFSYSSALGSVSSNAGTAATTNRLWMVTSFSGTSSTDMWVYSPITGKRFITYLLTSSSNTSIPLVSPSAYWAWNGKDQLSDSTHQSTSSNTLTFLTSAAAVIGFIYFEAGVSFGHNGNFQIDGKFFECPAGDDTLLDFANKYQLITESNN